MCWNCGCKMPEDDMGDQRTITTEDVAKAAIAMNMNGKDTLDSMKDMVTQVTPEDIDKKIEELKAKGEK